MLYKRPIEIALQPPVTQEGNFDPNKLIIQPLKASRCIKASFHIPENRLIFPTTKGFRKKISMKLFYQYMAIFLNFSPTSNHLHPLQVENCGSNSQLVVVEDDNGKLRAERVN